MEEFKNGAAKLAIQKCPDHLNAWQTGFDDVLTKLNGRPFPT